MGILIDQGHSKQICMGWSLNRPWVLLILMDSALENLAYQVMPHYLDRNVTHTLTFTASFYYFPHRNETSNFTDDEDTVCKAGNALPWPSNIHYWEDSHFVFLVCEIVSEKKKGFSNVNVKRLWEKYILVAAALVSICTCIASKNIPDGPNVIKILWVSRWQAFSSKAKKEKKNLKFSWSGIYTGHSFFSLFLIHPVEYSRKEMSCNPT